MLGRDEELEKMVSTFLGDRPLPARVALFGDPGIGKTTFALAVLHDERIKKHYEARYYVSCASCCSLNTVLGEMANVLQVPFAQ